MTEAQIALVSREVHPFGGGGLGNVVSWTAELLTELGEVTIVTTEDYEPRYRELLAASDERLPAGVRFEFIESPFSEPGSYFGPAHRWSAAAFEAICRLYPDGGPDLVEFPDYWGEAFVTLQARESMDRRVRNTLTCVRLHSSSEMCEVLDGRLGNHFHEQANRTLEREALNGADRILWPGGDVLGAYHRYYGADALAEAVRIRHTVSALERARSTADRGAVGSSPVRFLYMGRFERRKGVHNLLEALIGLGRDDWRLTLVGGDTRTAPLGLSQRRQLELMAAGDERIEFLDGVDRGSLLELVAQHDVCVIPSVWECWPTVALESFQVNRPVLSTPTGGLVEMVEPGRTGWLTGDTTPAAIAETVEQLLDRPEQVAELVDAGGPRAAFDRLTDPDEVRRGYAELLEESRDRRPVPRAGGESRSLVSVVVPYFQLERYLPAAIDSILTQTHRELEVIIVNDGSLREQDGRVLDAVAGDPRVTILTQPNSGLGAARNLGISQAKGEYVLPFDADNLAEPSLIERCLEVLEQDAEAAYATTWSRYIDELGEPIRGPAGGYQPLGNKSPLVHRWNVAGDATALIRREVFDRGFSYSREVYSVEDWLLYRELHRAGLFGRVIPERLLLYRRRADSMLSSVEMPHMEWIRDEIEAQLRRHPMTWTATPGGKTPP